MKKSWEDFEDECITYLSNTHNKNCTFEKFGKSDSTNSDIRVTTNNETFFIEVKEPLAQAGQFVLIPDNNSKTFLFSSKNKSNENKHTKDIINHMNDNFSDFCTAGTKGKELVIEQIIIDNWVMDYYLNKGVKYFITKNNDFIVIPIQKLGEYFNITAKYRIKRSGSSSAPKNKHTEIIDTLNKNYKINSSNIIGTKLLINCSANLNKIKFNIPSQPQNEFYLSNKGENIFEVKKLSNTCNMNVIFSIVLKCEQKLEDLKQFNNEFF